MSFPLVCQSCGAPSSSSTGVCPFCKTVFKIAGEDKDPAIAKIKEMYNSGKLAHALSMIKELEKNAKEESIDFIILKARVLMETEAPSSLIRSHLMRANLLAPDNQDVMECMDIMEAKRHLSDQDNDTGEQMLRSVLRHNPKNHYANFLLGSHLYRIEDNHNVAIKHLEAAVEVHPNFLRAWACLGTLYKDLGHPNLARLAFEKCLALEEEPLMKEFFEKSLIGL